MRKADRFMIAGLATALVAWASASPAGELQLRAVPKNILQSVNARWKAGKVVGAAKEKTPEGATIFEITLTDKGKNVDVTLTPDGTITLIEKEIERKGLPKKANDTLDVRYPKARYELVEEIYKVEKGKETLIAYEALLHDTQKQIWAVEFELDGSVKTTVNQTGMVD